ncbi:hypothetical protein, partial [Pseudomonas viridiflava]|uniref:hypothetical protein n=1 Tax=Pseudomonas viridiflava TaxID=33069 RepID=UPI0019822B7F
MQVWIPNCRTTAFAGMTGVSIKTTVILAHAGIQAREGECHPSINPSRTGEYRPKNHPPKTENTAAPSAAHP